MTVYAGGTVTTSRTVNLSDGATQTYTLGGNTAFTFSNWAASDWSEVTLILTQDGTGSRNPTWSGVKWPHGIVPTLALGAGDITIVKVGSPGGGTLKYGVVVGKDFA